MATISENLTQLQNTKDALKTAISSYYDTIDENTPFSAYTGVVDSLGGNFVNAFNGTNSVVLPYGITTLRDYMFSGCSMTAITIPSGVTSIGNNCFVNSVINEAVLPSTLQSIGNSAFKNTSIQIINFPEGLVSIGLYAFMDCYSLSGTSGTTLVLPNSLQTIGSSAFTNDVYIKTVDIGTGCTSIGKDAFKAASSSSVRISTCYCRATTPPTLTGNIFDTTFTNTVYVPSASVNAYKAADYWKNYSIKAIPEE